VAAMEADMEWLAVAIVVLSAVSAYFYLRVVFLMYFGNSLTTARALATPLLNVAIIVMVVANLALGLFSGGIIDLGDEWTSALTVASNINETS
jgi:NADH-quinone oxidoreductase subunit N